MSAVKTRVENHTLYVTLARPEVHNAFDPAMIKEITQIFRGVDTQEEIRAVLLSAEGKSFCSGGDLAYMKSMAKFSKEENRADAEKLYEMFDSIRSCPVPVIARAFGNVMAGGLGLIAVCDIVAAHKDTQFAFTEARLGLVASVISTFVIEKMHLPDLTEMMLTAEAFQVLRAKESGLIQFYGENEEVDDYLQSKLDYILGNGPIAVRETKSLLRYIREHSRGETRTRTTQLIADVRVSPEGQEGLKTFFEKTKPSWKSK